MTTPGYAILSLTALVAAIVGMLVFAVMRLAAVARQNGRQRNQDGAASAFVAATLQDAVTKLREQERASHARADASERLSSEIIASMTSGLMVVGGGKEVRTLNPAGRKLLNLGEGPLAGSFGDILAMPAPALARLVDECLMSGEPVVRRTIELESNGTPVAATHLGVTVSPIAEGDQLPHGAICLFTDLTAIVELEDELRLKESLARLGELTAGIAHEFRNGLATIHGYARLLDPEKVTEPYRAYVKGIRQETTALAEMVQNFLNFAKPSELSLSSIDLRAIVERAAEEIREDAWAKGGSVLVRGEFTRVEGDEILLRQAFSNLCRNALEACTEAGMPPAIVIEGVVQHDQNWARVTVSDAGPGIDPKVRDRIFRPFFTTRKKGTGLGLALVQKIVVTHSGRITATNGPSGGARMQVALPIVASREHRLAGLTAARA